MNDHRPPIPSDRQVSLVEIVDRALGAGVVITGDVTISLADVDLVYLNLRVLLGSVATIQGESPLEVGGETHVLGPGGNGRL